MAYFERARTNAHFSACSHITVKETLLFITFTDPMTGFLGMSRELFLYGKSFCH